MQLIKRRYRDLLAELKDVRSLLILTHANPDPDSLASAWVLGHILRKALGLRITLAYEGIIGRAENRAMVALLRIPLRRMGAIAPERYEAIALVDGQPYAGNIGLPKGLVPRVVIDHHPMRRTTRRIPFHDIRPDYGATATILTEYLHASGLPLTRRHATGLFYAIRSETQNLGRGSGSPDLRSFDALFSQVDNRMISKIEQAPISRQYLGLLDGAFQATRVYGNLAITTVREMPYPDVPAELADLILRVDQVRWALVIGRYEGDIYLSIRTQDPRGDAGRTLRRIVGELGKAGGHGAMAGGKIVPTETPLTMAQIERRLAKRARERLGVTGERGEPLLRRRPARGDTCEATT